MLIDLGPESVAGRADDASTQDRVPGRWEVEVMASLGLSEKDDVGWAILWGPRSSRHKGHCAKCDTAKGRKFKNAHPTIYEVFLSSRRGSVML